MLYAQIHLTLPAWVHGQIDTARAYPGDEAKVALAISLSRMNIEAGSGGPFGAAVFDADSDRIVSVGVNRVLPQNCSVAHAEAMAYMLAQQRLQRARLNRDLEDNVIGRYVLLPGADTLNARLAESQAALSEHRQRLAEVEQRLRSTAGAEEALGPAVRELFELLEVAAGGPAAG